MIIRNTIIGLVGFYLIISLMGSDNDNHKSAGIDAYSNCKRSTETQLVAAEYQLKYPSTSLSQIKHILCEDAK